jgi:penicillin-binding protein 1A
MAPQRSRPSSGPRRHTLRRLLKWLLAAIAVGFGALIVAVLITMASLPGYNELKSSPNGQMIRVHAADGTVIVSLGPSYGKWLTFNQLPQVMKDAMVATEDRRFRMHPGVDPIGIARSAWVRIKTGRWAQGGSTITQQIARNIFLTNTRTFARKFREIILALAMERKFSKDQILELYLNRVYFGGGAYGVDAASRKFFGHAGDTLSLPEAAIIAGLVKAPSNYSPTADAQAAIGRAGVVIGLMREQGKISAAEAAAADPENVKLAPEPRQNSVRYFTDWALAQLDTMIDNTTDPIEVWTTLALTMQRAADAAIKANTPPGTQGALVSLDSDGAVRAMVGGTDYVSSIYNRATQAVRQPGSAWKLFVYLAALEAGHKPEDRVVDEPIDIAGWRPRNSSGRFAGEMDIRTAFAFSVNTIAAKLGSEVGFNTVADMARRFGITTPINTHPSMVLGTSDVRLIDMTRAFAAVAANGVAVTPYAIVKVATASGDLLYEHRMDSTRVLVAPYVAQQMTDLLQTAVATGTGRAAQIGRPVAGKTGTTSSNKDGWFLGFSSGLTTGVWMGRDDARAIPGLQGGRAPARAFAAFMKVAVASRPVAQFDTEVTLPDWQLEPDEEAYFGAPDENLVDENGVGPAEPDAAAPPAEESIEAPPQLDQQWLDGVLNRRNGAAPAGPPPRGEPNRPPQGARPSQ